jgi:hypothetical protein
MPGMIAVICSGLVAVIAAVLAFLLTHEALVAATVGTAAFLLTFLVETMLQVRLVLGFQGSLRSAFPAPREEDHSGRRPPA